MLPGARAKEKELSFCTDALLALKALIGRTQFWEAGRGLGQVRGEEEKGGRC
jgi:hypothetical protein